MSGHLPGEDLVGGPPLGHHYQAARILVEAMHYAGPRLIAHVQLQAGEASEQGVDQRATAVPRRGVHHHPRGLIDHQHIGVLVHDVE